MSAPVSVPLESAENQLSQCLFFFFFGHTHPIWKLPGQGLNQSLCFDLRHSCDNALSLTHCPTAGTPPLSFTSGLEKSCLHVWHVYLCMYKCVLYVCVHVYNMHTYAVCVCNIFCVHVVCVLSMCIICVYNIYVCVYHLPTCSTKFLPGLLGWGQYYK